MIQDLEAFRRAVDSLRKLPSVGQKSAERMAYALLSMSNDDLQEFSQAVAHLQEEIHPCPTCGLYTNREHCEICQDPTRSSKTLIVVSYEKDASAFERLGSYHGRYHVLQGVLSAVNGVGVGDLTIDALLQRIHDEEVEEIIIATNPTIEGETTALFLAKLLAHEPVKVTRLAYGLPMGGHLDYADNLTLEKALTGRTNIKE